MIMSRPMDQHGKLPSGKQVICQLRVSMKVPPANVLSRGAKPKTRLQDQQLHHDSLEPERQRGLIQTLY